MVQIESRLNNKFKELKRKINFDDSIIFIEGEKILEAAFNASLVIEEVFVDEKNLSRFKLFEFNSETIITYLDNSLIADLYTTKHSPDSDKLICAIAKKPKCLLEDMLSKSKSLIYLDGIQDPANLGVISRMSLAFNSGGILISDKTVNPYNTKVIRSSAGAILKLPVYTILSLDELLDAGKNHGFKFIATTLRASKFVSEITNEKSIFIFGNEGHGLSDNVISMVDETIKIKHSKDVESLNVAFAVGIVMYEYFNKSL